MKRTLVTAILLCGLCISSFAQLGFSITTPQDDSHTWSSVHNRAELKPLQVEYSEVVGTRLRPLKLDMVPTIFGQRLRTATNWWSRPDLQKYPADLVLPIFGSGNWGDGSLHMSISGVLIGAHHADLHAVGNIGYIELYYEGYRDTDAAAVIYLRTDDKFVPLKSSNDFSKRLEWDKAKFDALKKWLEEHEPKVTELGLVAVSASSPNRVDLGGGTACVLKISGGRAAAVTSNSYTIYLTKEDPEQEKTGQFAQTKRFEHPGESWVFSVDGKFYRMTPILVQKFHEQIR